MKHKLTIFVTTCFFCSLGARFYNQLDAAYLSQDALEVELAKEIESSRSVVIAFK